MASIDNHILTVTEPTIGLDKMEFDSLGEGEENQKANTSKGYIITVSINKYVFSDDDISFMNLDCTGVLPRLDLTVSDSKGQFDVDTFPRDGDTINLRMGTLDKTSYKDIRMDFDIMNVKTPPQKSDGNGSKYIFKGRIKIPGLFVEDCKSYGTATSLEHMELMANDLKLGLATNIESSDDSMNLVLPFNSLYDTMSDLVKHSYVDEDSFQTYSIDPYYYVNYVNLNKLFNSKETLEDAKVAFAAEMDDQPHSGTTDAVNQAETPLVLTNHTRDEGTNRFIGGQSIRNMSGAISQNYGYKRVLQFYENDSEEGLISHDIESLSSNDMKDIEEPMRGRRDEDIYANSTKYKYVGRKPKDGATGNTHLNYEYSAIANPQNLAETRKMSLDIDLATFNPALHRYHKVPVLIYINDQDKMKANQAINDLKEDSGFENEKIEDGDLINPGRYVVDEFLSGYYVIGGMQYYYKAGMASIKQKINLLRREWPSRVNNISEDTVAPPTKPKPIPPTPPPIPLPVSEPTPPEVEPAPVDVIPEEPVFTIHLGDDLSKTSSSSHSVGSWFEKTMKLTWKVDNNELVESNPTISVKFSGGIEKMFDATVHSELKGDPWDSYNTSIVIPSGTFKDHSGMYDVEITLTYNDIVLVETSTYEFIKWSEPGTAAGRPAGYHNGLKRKEARRYAYGVFYSETYGIYEGRYTLRSEATGDYTAATASTGRVIGNKGETPKSLLQRTKSITNSQGT